MIFPLYSSECSKFPSCFVYFLHGCWAPEASEFKIISSFLPIAYFDTYIIFKVFQRLALSDKNCGFVTQILYFNLCIQFENKIYTVTIRSSGYFYWVYRCKCDKTQLFFFLCSPAFVSTLLFILFPIRSPMAIPRHQWHFWKARLDYDAIWASSFCPCTEGTVACVATAETKLRSDTLCRSLFFHTTSNGGCHHHVQYFRLKHARWRNR